MAKRFNEQFLKKKNKLKCKKIVDTHPSEISALVSNTISISYYTYYKSLITVMFITIYYYDFNTHYCGALKEHRIMLVV